MVKNLPTMQETPVQSLGQKDPLEKGMATHPSSLAWEIPHTEEPGRLQSMESQRVGTIEQLYFLVCIPLNIYEDPLYARCCILLLYVSKTLILQNSCKMLYYYLHFAVDETGSGWLSNLPETTQLWTLLEIQTCLTPSLPTLLPLRLNHSRLATQRYENADMR